MHFRFAFWRLFRLVVGGLLLLAGAMKLSATSTSFQPGSVLLDGRLATLFAGWEVVLGVWVLSGWSAHVVRWVVAVTFACFALVSGYLGWLGVSSCGCFGDVSVSPWWAFAADVGIVIAACLVPLPPPRATDWAAPDFVVPAGVGLALLTGAYVAGVWAYGSSGVALARLRGEVVVVDPVTVDFGAAAHGETRENQVTVWNFSRSPVRVVGGTADCACTALKDLPVTIPPGESRRVTIRLNFVGTQGVFVHTAVLMVEDGSATRSLSLTLRGLIETSGAVSGG